MKEYKIGVNEREQDVEQFYRKERDKSQVASRESRDGQENEGWDYSEQEGRW